MTKSLLSNKAYYIVAKDGGGRNGANNWPRVIGRSGNNQDSVFSLVENAKHHVKVK
jgi:hypothetical protein